MKAIMIATSMCCRVFEQSGLGIGGSDLLF